MRSDFAPPIVAGRHGALAFTYDVSRWDEAVPDPRRRTRRYLAFKAPQSDRIITTPLLTYRSTGSVEQALVASPDGGFALVSVPWLNEAAATLRWISPAGAVGPAIPLRGAPRAQTAVTASFEPSGRLVVVRAWNKDGGSAGPASHGLLVDAIESGAASAGPPSAIEGGGYDATSLGSLAIVVGADGITHVAAARDDDASKTTAADVVLLEGRAPALSQTARFPAKMPFQVGLALRPDGGLSIAWDEQGSPAGAIVAVRRDPGGLPAVPRTLAKPRGGHDLSVERFTPLADGRLAAFLVADSAAPTSRDDLALLNP